MKCAVDRCFREAAGEVFCAVHETFYRPSLFKRALGWIYDLFR
jgi:hypothetical protein